MRSGSNSTAIYSKVFSFQINSDVTITAEYNPVINRRILYAKVVNNSSFDVFSEGYNDHYISAGKSGLLVFPYCGYVSRDTNNIISGITFRTYDKEVKMTIDDTTNWSDQKTSQYSNYFNYNVKWNKAPIPPNSILPGTFTFTDM